MEKMPTPIPIEESGAEQAVKNSIEDRFYDAVEDEDFLESQLSKSEQKGDEKTSEKIKGYLAQTRELLDKIDAEMKEFEKENREGAKMRELGQAVMGAVGMIQSGNAQKSSLSLDNLQETKGFTRYNPFTGQEEHFATREELEDFNEYLKEQKRA